jgi:diguanylate cyclase (GGDEF)-like protein
MVRSALTRPYVLALTFIAAIATAGYVAMEIVVRTEARSIRILERSTRQRTLVERAAIVTQLLILAEEAEQRGAIRLELIRVLDALRSLHDAMVHPAGGEAELSAAERAAYFEEPLQLENRIHDFIEAGRTIAALPDTALSFDHPDYLVIIATAAGGTSAVLDSVVQGFVRENERGIDRLRVAAFGALIVMLLGLGLVAVGIFAPLVREMHRETELLERANETLHQLSALDGLTGIPNRRSFEERIDEEWRRALRDQASLAVLMIDIDHFKAYNDRYGHLQGDDCLVQIAGTLARTVNRPADFVARYGGEEFVAVLPDTDARGAALVADRVRQRIESLGMTHEVSPVAPVVTVSVGFAAVVPTGSLGVTDLLGASDRALYEAKRNGRNRIDGEAVSAVPRQA